MFVVCLSFRWPKTPSFTFGKIGIVGNCLKSLSWDTKLYWAPAGISTISHMGLTGLSIINVTRMILLVRGSEMLYAQYNSSELWCCSSLLTHFRLMLCCLLVLFFLYTSVSYFLVVRACNLRYMKAPLYLPIPREITCNFLFASLGKDTVPKKGSILNGKKMQNFSFKSWEQ